MRFAAPIAAATLLVAANPDAATEVWREPVTGMEMTRLPAGRFAMGSPPDQAGREVGEVRHDVELTREVWIGRHEVTRAEWRQVMGFDPSHFANGPDSAPVESVNWNEAREFLRRLSALSPGSRFRLPSEAEWEYACRAGATTAFAPGDQLGAEDANFDDRDVGGSGRAFRGRPLPVGSYPPNACGLFDLHGNVWEWVEDEDCPYPEAPVQDPLGHCGAEQKIIRGGSWFYGADSARCALRYTHRPQDRGFSLGFRAAREAIPVPTP